MANHLRRKSDVNSTFIKAGALTSSVKFVLSVFSLLLAASLLFQFTSAKDDATNTQTLLEQGIEQREALIEQANLIIDCTSPGGECYRRGQENTAEAVANLNIVSQYSVICGQREDGEQAILNCVNQEVESYLRAQKSEESNNN